LMRKELYGHDWHSYPISKTHEGTFGAAPRAHFSAGGNSLDHPF
jgi:hypothetical protein